MEINIKKVLKTIYKFDFTKLPPIISHGSEFFVSDNGISEFNQTFKKQDLDNELTHFPNISPPFNRTSQRGLFSVQILLLTF